MAKERLGADRAGGDATPVGTPAAPTAHATPVHAPTITPTPVPPMTITPRMQDAFHNKAVQPAAPDNSHAYVWIDTPEGGMWSLHQTSGTVPTGPISTGSGASGATNSIPIDHSTESGNQVIQDILGGMVGFSSDQIAKFYSDYKSGVPLAKIYDDIRQTPQYAQRFPGMAALVKTGNRISEAEYIAKENQDRSLLHAYLGPSSDQYNSTAELGKLIAGNVSSTELQSRLQAAQDSVLSADPYVIQALKDEGMSTGDLTAYWLNPDVALQDVQRRAQAGQIGGIALQSGFGKLSFDQANQLAAQGVSNAEAKNGFAAIAPEGQFTQSLPGGETGSVTQQDLLNATFNGDANAVAKINLLRQGRVGQFQEGGQVATDAQGAAGLGIAATR